MTIIRKISPGFLILRRAGVMTACLAGLVSLGACDYTDDVLSSTKNVLSTIAGDDNGDFPARGATTKPATTATPAPARASAPMAPAVPSAAATGTVVGQKVRNVRGDLQRLSDSINQHDAELQRVRATLSGDANAYSNLVSGMRARLRTGAAAGNPELQTQSDQARNLLEGMNGGVAELNALSSQVASDLALSAYAIQEIKAAFAMSGAVEEDHRQLNALQAVADRDVGLIHRLSQAIADDVARQNAYVAKERRDLAALTNAARNGASVAAQPSAVPAPAVGPASRRPLVTIRFDRPNVPYEQALYTAVSLAMDRRPDAMFDLVAVSPNSGDAAQVSMHADQAKRNAENVMRALTRMGLPAERLAISAMTSSAIRDSEVRIFVR